jgi:hypothetical protein
MQFTARAGRLAGWQVRAGAAGAEGEARGLGLGARHAAEKGRRSPRPGTDPAMRKRDGANAAATGSPKASSQPVPAAYLCRWRRGAMQRARLTWTRPAAAGGLFWLPDERRRGGQPGQPKRPPTGQVGGRGCWSRTGRQTGRRGACWRLLGRRHWSARPPCF